MANVTIRDLDIEVRDRLRLRAAMHGRSMEAEVCAILADAVQPPVEQTVADWLLSMREILDGEVLNVPSRTAVARVAFA